MDSSTRNRLLDAAWEVVAAGGSAAVTLREVAARAGVSRQAVYLHFTNRAGLFVAMARRQDEVSGFVGRLEDAVRLPARAAFRRVLEVWLAYVPDILPVARALEAGTVTGDDGAHAYVDRMARWRDVLLRLVERLESDGQLAPAWDVERATDWLWSRVHPSVYHHLVNERGWDADEVIARTLSSLETELLVPDRPRLRGR